jgi:hypothetical protein
MTTVQSECEALARRVRAFWASQACRHRAPDGATGPVNVGGVGSASTLVHRDETAVELGAPPAPSLLLVLPVADAVRPRADSSAAGDERDPVGAASSATVGVVEWLGPDLAALRGRRVGFVAMLIAHGTSLDDLPKLRAAASLPRRIEGLCSRPLADRLWLRIHRALFARGFSLAELGRSMQQAIAEEIGAARSVDVMLAADPNDALAERARSFATEADVLFGHHRKLALTPEGAFGCAELACEACDERPICDLIRQARAIVRQRAVEVPA